MIKAYLLKRNKSKSLTAQIRDAEREVWNRQRRVGVCTATLIQKIQQQMTAPANLLLAGGIGFILGELTQRQTAKSRGAADKPRAAETTPLMTALNLMTSVHTLYTALPLAWMMKSFYQPGKSGRAYERQFQPVAAASSAAGSRQKSRR
jgi:hypothetical protein